LEVSVVWEEVTAGEINNHTDTCMQISTVVFATC